MITLVYMRKIAKKKGKRYIKGKTKFVLPNEQKDVEYL